MADYEVAVVAGVGSGIGARFVETFAQADCRVVALARATQILGTISRWPEHWRNVATFELLTS